MSSRFNYYNVLLLLGTLRLKGCGIVSSQLLVLLLAFLQVNGQGFLDVADLAQSSSSPRLYPLYEELIHPETPNFDEDHSKFKREASYSPWMGKRGDGYSPWVGKRSVNPNADLEVPDEPRPKKFRPWAGKRSTYNLRRIPVPRYSYLWQFQPDISHNVLNKKDDGNYNWDRMKRTNGFNWDRLKKSAYNWDRLKKSHDEKKMDRSSQWERLN